MKATYIARNKYGTLRIYERLPRRVSELGEPYDFTSDGPFRMIPQDLFPEVTWENSPQRITLQSI